MKKRVLSLVLLIMLLIMATPLSAATTAPKSDIIIPNSEIKDNVYNKLKDFYKNNFESSIDIRALAIYL